MGVDDEKRPGDDLLGFWPRVIVGAVFAALYIATFGTRGSMLAGVISGVLGGVVIFLILKEADARRRRKRR